MKIKHEQLEINNEEPFANCKLKREKYSKILTKILESYSYGFVLAINNKWGTGKTTFIKMWEKDLKNQEYQTIYFNAWENDFEDNPLIALMGELKSISSISTQPKFASVLKNAASLSKHVAPILVKSIADKYINTEEVKNLIKGVSEGITDIFEKNVEEYETKKKNIKEFRKNLSYFIAETNNDKPLIFFIDELDRCRPNYAVSILEQIKHFFSVPNIIFVLSIDKTQLGNAVRGVYGSDKIDAEEYLRRFIDLEYSIPDPENKEFQEYLYDYFEFDEFFISEDRLIYRELKEEKGVFLKISQILFRNKQTSLREQEKIFALSRLALRSFEENNFTFPLLFLFLAFIKIKKPIFYSKLKNESLNIEELQNEFLNAFDSKIHEDNERVIIMLEAYLLNFYTNSLNNSKLRIKGLYEKKDNGENILNIDSIVNVNKNSELLNFLLYINEIRDGRYVKLSYLLSKLELLEDIKM